MVRIRPGPEFGFCPLKLTRIGHSVQGRLHSICRQTIYLEMMPILEKKFEKFEWLCKLIYKSEMLSLPNHK